MKTSKNLLQNLPNDEQVNVKRTGKISFSSFQKLIVANSEMRKQVKDIVDLALFDYALQQNEEKIQSFRERAESETLQLLMKFAKGVSNYKLLSRIIHRNRIIKTLANLDRRDQLALMNRLTHSMAV